MLNILINLKVIFSAIFIKIKKFYYKNYDPYLPLPKKLFLSPSSKITEEYRCSLLKMSYLNSKIDPLKWQNIARKKLSEGGELSEFYPRNAWSDKTEKEYSAWLEKN